MFSLWFKSVLGTVLLVGPAAWFITGWVTADPAAFGWACVVVAAIIISIVTGVEILRGVGKGK
jgi:hypothetical protein